MMVNPDVDGYTKTLNHREVLRKTQKNNNLMKAKKMPKPKYKLSRGQVSAFSFQGGDSLLCPRQLRHWLRLDNFRMV